MSPGQTAVPGAIVRVMSYSTMILMKLLVRVIAYTIESYNDAAKPAEEGLYEGSKDSIVH